MRTIIWNRIFGGITLLTFLFIIALGVGWIMNCVKFCRLDFKQPIKAEILRGIGLVPPIGAVMGWIPLKDGKVVEITEE